MRGNAYSTTYADDTCNAANKSAEGSTLGSSMTSERAGTPEIIVDVPPLRHSKIHNKMSLAQLFGWATRSGMAISDQACISGGNFLLYLLLARWLSPAEYGVFALVFSVYMFLLCLHQGLIQEPMSVLGHVTYGDDLNGYVPRILRLNLWLSGLLVLPVAVAGSLLLMNGSSANAHSMGVAFLSLAMSLPFLFLLWTARRMAYMRLLPGQAAINALIYTGLLIAGMWAMKAARQSSAGIAFGVMAVASGVAGARLLGKLGALRPPHGGIVDILRRHADFGKWMVAVGLFGWLARDAYYGLAATLISPAEAGALRAIGNLVTPLEQVLTALGVMLLPWLSALRSRGEEQRLRRRITQITLAFTGLGVAYMAVVWPASNPILQFAYHGKYNQFAWMVPWLLVPQVFRGLSYGGLMYLMITQRMRQVFYFAVGAGAPTIVGAILMNWWGLRGIICGMLLSSIISTFLAKFYYWKAITTEDELNQS